MRPHAWSGPVCGCVGDRNSYSARMLTRHEQISAVHEATPSGMTGTMRSLAAAVIGGILLVAAFYAGRHTAWREPGYESQREKFVLVQAALSGPVDTLVLGDSITESNLLDGLCGKTFAAAIGGARVADMLRLAPTFIRLTNPKRIVLAIETNDTWQRSKTFASDYAKLLRSLPIRPFVLVGAKDDTTGVIPSYAKAIGADYVPPIPSNLTWDGHHPTPAGARWWRDSVARSCPTH